MCYSPLVSFSFFAIGASLAVFSYYNDKLRSSHIHIIFGFYALMELLQTVQYLVVNDCESKANQLLTEAAYILVIVQPLMWNTIFYLRTTPKYQGIFVVGIVLSGVWIAANVMARLLYNPANATLTKDTCGFFNNPKTCTMKAKDNSHLYWKWTSAYMPDMTANYFMYFCMWFIPALIVPHTRFTAIGIIISAIIGLLVTMKYGATIAEFPSTWCFISVPLMTTTIITSLLKI